MSDDELRAMYAKVLVARARDTRDGCVAPEALLALVERKGPEEERLRTLGHAMSCPACGRELDLLRAVHAVRASTATPMRRAAPFAIAASLLVVAGIALVVRASSLADADRLRGSDEVSPVAPLGTVPDSRPLTIVWHRVPQATGYEVTVIGEDGAQLARRTTSDTTVSLGADVTLRRDVDYTWTVTASLPDNVQRRSAAQRFRLRAP